MLKHFNPKYSFPANNPKYLNTSLLLTARVGHKLVSDGKVIDGITNSFTRSIGVSGSDLYVVGYTGNSVNPIATYWKNGVAHPLGNGIATGIALSGSDVYISGHVDNNAVYWKNGTLVNLGKGFAFSITLGK